MKSAILVASAVAALSSAAMADITVNLGNIAATGGQFGSAPAITGVTGTLTSVVISYNFQPSQQAATSGSWASDGALNVNGFQWGGYDIFVNGATNFVSTWAFDGSGSAPAGVYSDTRTDVPGGLASPTTLNVSFGNGWSSSPLVNYNDVTVTFVGLSVVPTPGAAAVLGLGGLALGRRRRA